MLFGLHHGVGRAGSYQAEQPLDVEKIIFAVGNVVKQVNPDFTGLETLYTWSAETQITGLAYDALRERIFMTGSVTGEIQYVDSNGTNPTLFHTLDDPTDYGMLAIDQSNDILLFTASASSAFNGTVEKIALEGGEPVQITNDGVFINYAPIIQRIAVREPSGTDSIDEYDVDGGNNDSKGSSGGEAVTGGFFDPVANAWFITYDTGYCRSIDRDTESYELFITGTNKKIYQGEFDHINYEGYFIVSSGESELEGIWKLSRELLDDYDSQHAGAVEGVTVYNIGATSSNAQALCLKYNKPNWQTLIQP